MSRLKEAIFLASKIAQEKYHDAKVVLLAGSILK